ncbi:MAG: flavodoxin [Burkholderiales bacterium]|nr:flavodoxin [Burkholderiales bacterium]
MTPTPRALVVYHSRTGRTRRIGKMLAARLKADVDEIVLAGPAGRSPSEARCAFEAAMGRAVSVKAARCDPAQYELVLIGSPVWCWSLAAPVRGWLKAHPLGSAQAAFFCTLGGSGAERVFAQMQDVCGKRARATLALTQAQVEAGPRAAIDAFIARLVGQHARAEAAAEASAPLPEPGPLAQAHSRDAHGTG